jgi:hypothetical protein
MSRITQETDISLVNIWVRIMHPQSPWLNFLANLEMLKNLVIELRIWLEKIFNW